MNKRIAKKVLRAWPSYNVATYLNGKKVRQFAYTAQHVEHALTINNRVFNRHEATALARRKSLFYERWGRWDPYREWRPRFAQLMRARRLVVPQDATLYNAIVQDALAKAGAVRAVGTV